MGVAISLSANKEWCARPAYCELCDWPVPADGRESGPIYKRDERDDATDRVDTIRQIRLQSVKERQSTSLYLVT